jgi:hypothetical protein
MARRQKIKKQPAEKKKRHPTIEPLLREPEGGETPHAYRVMDWLIDEYHSDLAEANIVIAKHMGNIREDVDGTVGFGRVKRGNDLDRAYAEYDFVLIIPYDMFEHSDSTKRHAIIDSLLCQCAVQKDRHGEPVVNSKNQTIYRTRKPIKVFPENIRRYGLWQNEAVKDAVGAYNDSKRPLLPENRKKAKRFSDSALDKGEAPPETHLKNGEASGKHKANGKAKASGTTANGKTPPKEKVAPPKPEPGTLEALELPHPILEACHAADLRTVDDVVRFHAEYGQIALAELKNMGSERADSLWSAVERYQAEHAETAEAK